MTQERDDYMRRQEADHDLLRMRGEFPGGYFACCGMSKARGHAALCPRAKEGSRHDR